MAGPRSFSEDGAAGAGGVAGADPFQQGGNGQSVPSGFNPAAIGMVGMPSGSGGSAARSTPSAPQGPRMGTTAWTNQFLQDTGGYNRAAGLSFAEGGAIDDGSGGGDSNGSPQQDAIQKALSTVDGVLAYGRQLHGLGGGDNEGGGIQTADAGYQNNRMPARPGNQSESGVPPIQPAPGPLPPTSNPFGKRTSDNSGGDRDGEQAIDTEETA